MAYYKLIREKSLSASSSDSSKAVHGNLYLVQHAGLRERLTHIRENFSSVSPESNSGKAIPGHLYRVEHRYSGSSGEYVEHLIPICSTLENADYLIPALVYKVSVTQSPKFQRMLPILLQVPGRTGIRVHQGLRPEHSKGCILVSPEKEHLLTELWLKEQQNHDETRIEICDCRRSAKGLDQSPL